MQDIKALLTPTAFEIFTAIGRTRNPRTLSAVVKQAIFTRDVLLGKDPAEPNLKLDKIVESKVRERTEQLCAAIAALTERKDVSVVCAAAIKQRKVAREARASAPEASAE